MVLSTKTRQFSGYDYSSSIYSEDGCEFDNYFYEENNSECVAKNTDCDTAEGYSSDYLETCDNGYYYSENCTYDDYTYNEGTCINVEINDGYEYNCTQLFSYNDETWESLDITDCKDNKNGYDYTLSIYDDFFFGLLSNSYYENNYFYVKEDRNITGTCITDTEEDLDNY
mmetsp:Transcript_15490/g.13527  ORF Transcript_15490/g.13527 Transcript_15490/m.13527 type:complete len:170 (+) Transcript_15490:33-542(+)